MRRDRRRTHARTWAGNPQRSRLVVLFLAATTALGLASPALAASPGVQPQSRGCRSCVAQGVDAITGRNAWIVGFRGGPGHYVTWARQWNGSHWHNVESQNPGESNELFGVSGTSPSDVWAVGYFYENHAAKSLLEHWDGTAWTWVPGPLSESSPLYDVSAVSPSDVWAVGHYISDVGQRSLIMHWDGSTWTQVASPNPSGASNITLKRVSADSATDAWALGSYKVAAGGQVADNGIRSFVVHWDGQSWQQVSTQTQGLQDISADATTDAWAVGTQGGQTVAEGWNGGQWSRVATPNPGAGFAHVLDAVDALSPSDAWATGFYDDLTTDRALILRWDGQSWTDAQAPAPNHSHLYGVSASSATDAWAIGSAAGSGNQHVLLEHWDGTSWTEG